MQCAPFFSPMVCADATCVAPPPVDFETPLAPDEWFRVSGQQITKDVADAQSDAALGYPVRRVTVRDSLPEVLA